MTMSPALRKLVLTIHVTTSVGWLGAVAAFLVLALVGLRSADAQMVRASYLAMERLGGWVIVPASLASVFIGTFQALGTPWGLVRHYWVAIKLVLTVLAALVLLLHIGPIEYMAHQAAAGGLTGAAHREIRLQLVVDAAAALVVLLVTTTLSVYKPRGLTPFGVRALRNDGRPTGVRSGRQEPLAP
jgi:hypothetical protein